MRWHSRTRIQPGDGLPHAPLEYAEISNFHLVVQDESILDARGQHFDGFFGLHLRKRRPRGDNFDQLRTVRNTNSFIQTIVYF